MPTLPTAPAPPTAQPPRPDSPRQAPLAPSVRQRLRQIVDPRYVLTDPAALAAYAYDATAERRLPSGVVLPATAQELAAVLRVAKEEGLAISPRGAGTNISGGTLPIAGEVVVSTQRMTACRIDAASRVAYVEPGLVNFAFQEKLRPHGLHFAPDPASYRICTLGGNAAENSGGPHCLKYGVTSQHVLGLRVVLYGGEAVQLGGPAHHWPGLDLRGLFVGSEGTFGVIAGLWVKLTPLPAAVQTLLAVFPRLDQAIRAVSAVIRHHVVPATMEFLDQAAIRLIERHGQAGLPQDAGAVLLIELDGSASGVSAQMARVLPVLREQGAVEVRVAQNEAEREALWRGRRSVYGAAAQMGAHLWTQDVVVPRSRLPEMLERVVAIGQQYGFAICTVGHAGDGNLHPLFAYDPNDPDSMRRLKAADRAILEACVALGGSITGEHGIGLDKRESLPLCVGTREIEWMARLKAAFDPLGRLNAGKALPVEVQVGATEPPAPTRLQLDEEDMVLHVPADTTLAEAAALAATAGLRLEAAWAAPAATVADWLTRAQAGPWLAGAVRDAALGLWVEAPGGPPLYLGGQTIKNVAGYDLTRLWVGSGGRFGRLLGATLKLSPLPAAVRHYRLAQEAVPPALPDVAAYDVWREGAGWIALLRLEGEEEDVAAQERMLTEQKLALEPLSEAQAEAEWRARLAAAGPWRVGLPAAAGRQLVAQLTGPLLWRPALGLCWTATAPAAATVAWVEGQGGYVVNESDVPITAWEAAILATWQGGALRGAERA